MKTEITTMISNSEESYKTWGLVTEDNLEKLGVVQFLYTDRHHSAMLTMDTRVGSEFLFKRICTSILHKITFSRDQSEEVAHGKELDASH